MQPAERARVEQTSETTPNFTAPEYRGIIGPAETRHKAHQLGVLWILGGFSAGGLGTYAAFALAPTAPTLLLALAVTAAVAYVFVQKGTDYYRITVFWKDQNYRQDRLDQAVRSIDRNQLGYHTIITEFKDEINEGVLTINTVLRIVEKDLEKSDYESIRKRYFPTGKRAELVKNKQAFAAKQHLLVQKFQQYIEKCFSDQEDMPDYTEFKEEHQDELIFWNVLLSWEPIVSQYLLAEANKLSFGEFKSKHGAYFDEIANIRTFKASQPKNHCEIEAILRRKFLLILLVGNTDARFDIKIWQKECDVFGIDAKNYKRELFALQVDIIIKNEGKTSYEQIKTLHDGDPSFTERWDALSIETRAELKKIIVKEMLGKIDQGLDELKKKYAFELQYFKDKGEEIVFSESPFVEDLENPNIKFRDFVKKYEQETFFEILEKNRDKENVLNLFLNKFFEMNLELRMIYYQCYQKIITLKEGVTSERELDRRFWEALIDSIINDIKKIRFNYWDTKNELYDDTTFLNLIDELKKSSILWNLFKTKMEALFTDGVLSEGINDIRDLLNKLDNQVVTMLFEKELLTKDQAIIKIQACRYFKEFPEYLYDFDAFHKEQLEQLKDRDRDIYSETSKLIKARGLDNPYELLAEKYRVKLAELVASDKEEKKPAIDAYNNSIIALQEQIQAIRDEIYNPDVRQRLQEIEERWNPIDTKMQRISWPKSQLQELIGFIEKTQDQIKKRENKESKETFDYTFSFTVENFSRRTKETIAQYEDRLKTKTEELEKAQAELAKITRDKATAFERVRIPFDERIRTITDENEEQEIRNASMPPEFKASIKAAYLQNLQVINDELKVAQKESYAPFEEPIKKAKEVETALNAESAYFRNSITMLRNIEEKCGIVLDTLKKVSRAYKPEEIAACKKDSETLDGYLISLRKDVAKMEQELEPLRQQSEACRAEKVELRTRLDNEFEERKKPLEDQKNALWKEHHSKDDVHKEEFLVKKKTLAEEAKGELTLMLEQLKESLRSV